MKQLITEIYEELSTELQPIYKQALEDIAYYRNKYDKTANQKYIDDINRCSRIIEDLSEVVSDKKINRLLYQLGQVSGIVLKGVITGLLTA